MVEEEEEVEEEQEEHKEEEKKVVDKATMINRYFKQTDEPSRKW